MSTQTYEKKLNSKDLDQEDNTLISTKIKKEIKDIVEESESQLLQHKKRGSNNYKKGFASMTQAKVKEIAKKGGSARAAQLGHAGFVALGRKGGEVRAAQLGHAGFVELGRKGGEARTGLRLRKALERQKDMASSLPNDNLSLSDKSQKDSKEKSKKYSINTEKIRQKQLEKKNKEEAA